MSARAIAQTVSQVYIGGPAGNSPKDIYVNPRNSPVYIGPIPTPKSSADLPEVRAFLDTIAWAETGTIHPKSYKSLVFKGNFRKFSTHPKIQQCARIKGRRVCSNAAGRYQIMAFNWAKLAPKLRLKDFSPKSQDKIALYLIQQTGAMPDVLAGKFEQAACKVSRIWAGFPCNSYGQRRLTMAQLKNFYYKRLKVYRGK